MNIRKITAGATAALLVSGGLVLASAGMASAHTPVLSVSCTSIELNLTSYPSEGNMVTATLDDVVLLNAQPFGSEYHSGAVALDPGVAHAWTVVIDSADGDAYDTTLSGSSSEDCLPEQPPVVPDKPADTVVSVPVESQDCDTRVITTTTTTTTTGTELVNNVWVPTEPVVTTSTATREATAEECPLPPVEEPPVVQPPAEQPPVVEPPADQPAIEPVVAAQVSAEQPKALAATGPNTGAIWAASGLSAALLLAGAAMFVLRRRQVS